MYSCLCSIDFRDEDEDEVEKEKKPRSKKHQDGSPCLVVVDEEEMLVYFALANEHKN